MKYYLIKSETDSCEGPYTLDEISARVEDGVINSSSLVTADIGETQEQLKKLPKRDWMSVMELSGVKGIGVPEENSRARDASNNWPVTLIVLIVMVLFLGFLLLDWLQWALRDLH